MGSKASWSTLPYQGLYSQGPSQCLQSSQWGQTAPHAWWRAGSVHTHHPWRGEGEGGEFWSCGGWTGLDSDQNGGVEREEGGSVRMRLRRKEPAAGPGSDWPARGSAWQTWEKAMAQWTCFPSQYISIQIFRLCFSVTVQKERESGILTAVKV